MPHPKRSKLSRRQRIILIAAASLILLPPLALRFLLSPIVGNELISLIEARLNARLTVGHIAYRPLYGLSLFDCHLVFVDPAGKNTELLSFSELTVRLARLPFHRGPLQVENLTIRDPVIHLVHTADGFVGHNGLLKPDTSPKAPNHQKLSNILRLRQVTIDNGQLVYEDQTTPAGHSLALSGIGIHIATVPKNAAEYDFKFDANTGDLSTLRAAGNFDVDELSAAVDPINFSVELAGGKAPSQLPPEIQAILERYQVKGKLLVDGTASGSFTQAGQSKFSVTFKLHDAAAYVPQVDGALDDLQLEISAGADAHGGTAQITTFSAKTGGVQFALQPGANLALDPAHKTWKLQQLSGAFTADRRNENPIARGLLWQLSPDGAINFSADLTGPMAADVPWPDTIGQLQVTTKDLTLRPAGCDAPVVITAGPIRLVGRVLSIRDIVALYGGDQFTLSSARIPIAPFSQGLVRCTEFNASLSIHPGGFAYPLPLGKLMAQFQPGGHFAASGNAGVDLQGDKPKFDYDVLLSGDNGVLSVRQIPINQIQFDAEIKPDGAQLADFQCQTLDGKITANSFTVIPRPPFEFTGNVFMSHLNLGDLDNTLKLSKTGSKVNGFADVSTHISGSAPVDGNTFLDLFRAEGQFELSQGNLWSIPALQKIENSMSIAKEALTVGRAAALFRIADRTIELQDAAISSPAYGIMGWGTIGFNGQLDIHAVATLLGDWKQQLSKSSDFLGDIAGAVQDFLNTATSQLLYQIRLTGPASNPNLESTRGNALTKKDAQTLGNMVQQSNDARPIDMLNHNPQATPPTPAKKP